MRIYASSLLLLMCAFVFGPNARASSCADIRANCLKSYDSRICERAENICSIEVAAFGAGAAPGSTSDSRLAGSGRSRSLLSQANQCCAGSLSCAFHGNDEISKNALAALVAAKASADATVAQGPSTNGSSARSRDLYVAQADVEAAAAGACYARSQLCIKKNNEWLDKGVSDPSLAEAFRNQREACTSLSASKGEQAMKTALASAESSGGSEQASSGSDPSAPDAASTGAGLGLGNINSQGMMGLLQAVAAMQQSATLDVPQDPPIMDCSNQAIAGCTQFPQQQSWNGEGATAEMKVRDDRTGSFNIDPSGLSGPGPVPLPGNDQNSARPNSAGAVPNGGGGIPGGGGGAASLGGGGGGGAQVGAAKNTDIMHGERSGGFAQTNAEMTMTPGGSGGFGGYGRADNLNMDLAQYLPKTDGGRKLAGAELRPASAQINGSSVNIWNRISDHFKSRCNQGLLRDCVP